MLTLLTLYHQRFFQAGPMDLGSPELVDLGRELVVSHHRQFLVQGPLSIIFTPQISEMSAIMLILLRYRQTEAHVRLCCFC